MRAVSILGMRLQSQPLRLVVADAHMSTSWTRKKRPMDVDATMAQARPNYQYLQMKTGFFVCKLENKINECGCP